MEADTLKNVLRNVIHFLEHEKSFELRDEPSNNLELFLLELSRARKMANLDEMCLERTIPVPSGGQKCRFGPAKIETEIVERKPEKISFKKITRAALTALLSDTYEDVKTSATRRDNTPVTEYFVKGELVGSWSKSSGWYMLK